MREFQEERTTDVENYSKCVMIDQSIYMTTARSSEKKIYFTSLYKNATVTCSRLFQIFLYKNRQLKHYSPLNDSHSANADSKSGAPVFSKFLSLFLLQWLREVSPAAWHF